MSIDEFGGNPLRSSPPKLIIPRGGVVDTGPSGALCGLLRILAEDPKSHVDPDEAPRGYASKRNAVDPPVVRRRAGSGIEVAAVGEVAGERAAVPTCDIGNLATAAPPAPPATDFCFDELD